MKDLQTHVALSDMRGNNISHAELDNCLNSFSDKLKECGVQHQTRVAILLDKSIEAVVSILTVRKLGAVYIPIDVHSPRNRICKIIDDCSPDIIIHNGEFNEYSGEKFIIPSPDALTLSVVIHRSTSDPSRSNVTVKETLAYILYTSGSTGAPKGVCVSERAAYAFINWCINTFSIDSSEQIASIAPFHFDLSVCDIYASYLSKATLHLFKPNEVNNVRLMRDELHKRAISFIYSTPSFLSALINYGKIDQLDWSSMSKVLFAGEVFHTKPLHTLMQTMTRASFYNLYGPTETNVCTFHKIEKEESRVIPYPIGNPCAGHQFEITPEGELLIGGPNVAQGYLNQTALTAERFFFKNNLQWFRTGDIVKQEDGSLVYCGRIDKMIKRKGYRIEPGEIESAALLIKSITAAACFSKANEDNEIRIFLLCEGSYEFDQIQLKSDLLNYIPDYMLPDVIKLNSSIPLTSTGKTDYTKLIAEAEYF